MINVLVVDDSAFMRKVLSDILSKDEDIHVLATARDGIDAISKIKQYNPDVVTLDVEMPKLDGLSALKQIMDECPKPVIMLSAHTNSDSGKALDALKYGAIDIILKPSGEISLDIGKKSDEIISKIKIASKANIKKNITFNLKKETHKFTSTRDKVVVVASSTGGPQTLEVFLTQLPKSFPVPIVIVQHIPKTFTKSLANRLNSICGVNIKEAEKGEVLKKGVVYIAPGGIHSIVTLDNRNNPIIDFLDLPPEQGVKPCADILFKSVAQIYKDNTIGIVLTGMGKDGCDGSRVIKENLGTIIAQEKESCVIYGMPKEVIERGYADLVISLEKLPVALIQLLDI